MDPNKLHVANIQDHQRGKLRGLACVTMTSSAFANAARSSMAFRSPDAYFA